MNKKRWSLLPLLLLSLPASAQEGTATLTVDEAVQFAVAADPWLDASAQRESALNSEAVYAGTLPDPMVSLTAANFPVDTFDIGQEAMTQLMIGVTQKFPRGHSRSLASRHKRQLAGQEPVLREDRQARVRSMVTQLWLDAYSAQESIRLIEQDRSLFEDLVDATRVSYSTALGGARQHDVIRAQLELTRLDDRLTRLHQDQEAARHRLSEWIGGRAVIPLAGEAITQASVAPMSLQLAGSDNAQMLYGRIAGHPALRALDERIAAMQTGVELARQKYKPEWGLNARYGYRDEDPAGRDRSDLLSVGLTFDLPLFTSKRQDQALGAARSRAEELRTQKLLMARKMTAELDTALSEYRRLDQRAGLFAEQLLPQMSEQAEAALSAYNNDVGDFAEAVRARIAELNARIEALEIDVEKQRRIARIDYLLTGSLSPKLAAGGQRSGSQP